MTSEERAKLREKIAAALALCNATTGECQCELPKNAWGDAVVAMLEAAPALLDRLDAAEEKAKTALTYRGECMRLQGDLSAAQARIAELEMALKPFQTFGVGEDDDLIVDGLMRDRICDWFGPSDFAAARALDKTGEG